MKIILLIIQLLVLLGCQATDGDGSNIISNNIPTESKFTITTPLNKTYTTSQNIDIILSYPNAVTVSGTPGLELIVGTSTKVASYLSGSGTQNLTFRYTVAANDSDTDGIVLSDSMILNNGTMTYLLNGTITNCPSTFVSPNLTTVKVDSVAPTLISLTAPIGKAYFLNEVLFFTAIFSENVNVIGSPRIALNIGGTTRYAIYSSGRNTSALIFAYMVGPNDSDVNGIGINSPIELNGGSITDTSLPAITNFTAPDTSSVLIYGSNPLIVAVTPPSNGTYSNPQNLDFNLTFNKTVNVIGNPRLVMTLGSSTKYATYLSGSGTNKLLFRYPVLSSDLDTNGISIANLLDLNGGSIKDPGQSDAILAMIVPPLTGVMVSNTAAGIVSVATSSPNPSGGYDIGQNIDFHVTYSEVVIVTGNTSRLKLDIGGITKYANYQSGSGTNTLLYRYTVAVNDFDLGGINLFSPLELNGSDIKGTSGITADLTFSLPDTTSVVVDAKLPSIISNTVPSPGTYLINQNLEFDVTYDKVVIASGVPRLSVDFGGISKYANYVSGTNSNTLKFRYTIVGTDNDLNGIGVSSEIDLNGGTIKDSRLHNASLALLNTATSGVLIDTAAPTINSITLPANGTYVYGNVVDFIANFSEVVTVTGSPKLSVEIGSNTRQATYLSGTGTNAITFRYEVASNDIDNNGITLFSPLDIQSSSIKDTVGINAILNFTPPNTTGILVDLLRPKVSNIILPANGKYITGQNIDIDIVFNESVVVTPPPRLALNLDSGTVYANYISGGGSNTLKFRYIIASGDFAVNAFNITSPIDANGGAIQNLTLTVNADLTFNSPNTSGIQIDGLNPTISSITPPDIKNYKLNDHLDFIVNYSSKVIINGTPRLTLTVGSTTQYAYYLSGSGSNAITFRYTVGSSDLDSNGIAIVGPGIDLNSGTIKDIFNDDALIAFSNTDYPDVKVDGIAPIISSLTPPTIATYYINNNLDFSVAFSEAVIISGTPRIALTVGTNTKYATYLSGTGTNNLIFRYTVANGDSDNNGIGLSSSIELNTGSLKDSAGNDLFPLTFAPADTTAINVDGSVASIISVATTSGTYKTNQNLDLAVTFTQPVTVTGSPQLQMDASGDIINATYLSGSGSSVLIFRYTITPGKIDQDGITISSPLVLNGGTIVNSSSQSAALVFTVPSTPNVFVDGIDLIVTTITAPGNKTYVRNENLDFVINYNYPANVIGSPRLPIMIGSTSKYATYLSGSGSSSLTFRYTVSTGDIDADGVQTIGPVIDLNSATIKDGFNDNAALAFTDAIYDNVKIDGIIPFISSVTAPPNNTYYLNSNLDFTLAFSEAVTITGTPRIAMTVGSATKYATYLSGSGTATVTFRYTVSNGDSDTNGIALSSPLQLNLGTIKDAAGNALNPLTFTAPDTSLIFVSATNPVILSITLPANGKYTVDQNLDFDILFSEAVLVTPVPRIALTIGSGTVYANYLSGGGTNTLKFRYTVASGDHDIDGLEMTSPADTNGGAIQNLSLSSNANLTFPNQNTSGLQIDGLNPVIASITPPANKNYILNENLDFIVNYSATVNVSGFPRLPITVGSTTKYANYFSGTGTSAITFRYTAGATDLDSDGIETLGANIDLNSGTIKDIFNDNASLAFTAAAYANIKVDGIVPVISSLTPPANATYYINNNIDFNVAFSEAVTITGTPRIVMTVGSATKYATYLSGSGTATVTFRYTVSNGDSDSNGIALSSPLQLNLGTIKDAAGNALNPLTFTAPDTTGVNVDGTVASIISVAAAPATYKTSQNLDLTVSFTQPVTVTGSPTIQINVSGETINATYLSGSGTSALVFRYTVIAGKYDQDGITLSSPVLLNAGTIVNASSQSATLTFTPPDTSAVIIDGLDLTIASVTPPANKTFIQGENLDFVVNYNYPANVTGSPRIALTVGSTTKYANYFSGTGTSAITFRYTAGATDLDSDGIDTLGPNIDLNSGTIKDIFNDNASLAFTAAAYANIKVDGIVPLISSLTAPANATYYINNNIDFNVAFSEAVTITGTPRLAMTVGSATKYATYLSGSGTATVTFRYTVSNGDSDTNGIALSSPLQLNLGTIKDAAGNALNPLTFTAPDTTGVNVDGTVASIISVAAAPATYKTSQNLDLTVSFTQPVTVTGSPTIQINVSGETINATYLSGSGTSALVFRYTVLAGKYDQDGITLSSPVLLNAGTIVNASSQSATLTFTPPDTSAVIIDGVDLLIASVTPPANKTFIQGENLDFVVNYNYPANITGSPRLALTVGSTTKYANYFSGTGSSAITFRYTIGATDLDSDGIETLGANIDLNSGTIKDIFNDNASLAFTAAAYANIKVDGIVPLISSLTAPANATYYINNNLDLTLAFSEAVTITGTPRLAMTVGSATKYATYLSGSGTSTVTFRYTVSNGDSDTNGIALSSPLQLNLGTIKDAAGNALNPLTFTTPDTSLIFVSATNPVILSITLPANGKYTVDQNLDFDILFSEAVLVTPVPRIALTIGSGTVYANYLSGGGTNTLKFRYTVASGDHDIDGLEMTSPADTNGGAIQNLSLSSNANLTFPNQNTSGLQIDGLNPVIASITPPANKNYILNENLDFIVNYSATVNVSGFPRLPITVGSTTKYANYFSGTGTSAITFRYTAGATDLDSDGIETLGANIDLNSGTIKDIFNDNASLAFTAAAYANIKVDGIVPVISSLTPPANATYYINNNIDFNVAFSEAVTITGTPRIVMTVGSATKYATYLSGSGTATVTFRYTVSNGDSDSNGIALSSPLQLNLGTIKDAAGNALNPLTFTAPDTTGVNIDGTVASIISVAAAPATYKTSQNLDLTVSFTQPVTVTGSPTIQINVSGETINATYLSGSGTSALIFRYTVIAGKYDQDGITLSSPVLLNAGTIVNASSQSATLTFTPPDTSAVIIDGLDLTIASVTPPANKTFIQGENLDFVVNYNYPANITGSPRLAITVGSTTKYANYFSGTGTSAITFRYTAGATDLDSDGIETLGANIDLNSGTIKDIFNDNASLAFTAAAYANIKVDGIVPLISSLTAPANATYYINNNLDFTLAFSEAVTITGTPRIAMTVGSATKYATYLSGSGTSTVTFRYTVSNGDSDTNGIALSSPLQLNLGTIKDAAGNALNPLTFTAPDTTGVNIDGTVASIISVAAAPATYKTSQNLDLTVSFTQPVTVTGSPTIQINVSGETINATYLSGSGTSALIFRYTVIAGKYDQDGITLSSPVLLNAGTIVNASSQSATLTFTPPDTSAVIIDGLDLTIASVTPPANKTFIQGENLDFVVNYNYPANITGSPRLALTVGSTTKYANYFSGTGTSALTFRYNVGTGDLDNDGITLPGPGIDLNSGTIQDVFSDNANLALTSTAYPNINVDGVVPVISSVNAPTNSTYYINNNLDFNVIFTEDVIVNGAPRIALSIGSSVKFATYYSGSGTNALTFRYSVMSGDNDTDGIGVSNPLQLNNGTIKDTSGNSLSVLTFSSPNTSMIFVSATNPIILSLTLPTNGKYTTGQNLDFHVVFSESILVTPPPRIALTLASGTVYANYLSGGGTNTLKFRYTVASGDHDIDGLEMTSPIEANGGAIQNLTLTYNADLTFNPQNTSGLQIDGLDPVIASVTVPVNKTYALGENLNFVVNYTNSVTVTGNPSLNFTLGSSIVSATYLSGSGTSSISFRYTPIANDLDTDGISVTSPLSLNGGSIKDAFLDNAATDFTSPATNGIMIDAVAPVISTVAGPSPGLYYLGENLDFDLTFSKSVNVIGLPRIAITVGTSTLYASYFSGSGTSLIKFRYTVGGNDLDNNGIDTVSPLQINSGTIKDISGNNLSPLTFTAPNTALVNVDGTSPTIESVTAPAAATYQTSQNLDFVVLYSKPVNITGNPRISLNVGSSTVYANYFSGSGTSSITFRYSVAAGSSDPDGISMTSPVEINAGTIKDFSGINAFLTYTTPNTSGILVDGIDLLISSITPPNDGFYGPSQNLNFTVNFNYPAFVTGYPRIQLLVGVASVYATYVSGSGTSAHLYRYTVVTSDSDMDGITTSSNLNLNGGTIKDSFGGNATITFNGENYPNKKVDAITPVLSSVGGPVSGTYLELQNLDFNVNFSENVIITGTPRIQLTIGSTTRYANYVSGSGTSSAVFRYSVQAGDQDLDGITSTSPLDLNSGNIKDAANNSLSPLTFTVPDTTGVKVDANAAYILSVSPPANGTYRTNNNIDFVINFSRPVDITGSPRISLSIGASALYATYLSGSGTSEVTFRYTVGSGESDGDGILLTSPINLNGGTIKDSSLVNATLVFTPPATSGILVDGIDLIISSIAPPSQGTYKIDANMDFIVNFNGPAIVTGTPRISLTIGSTTLYANYISGSGTSAHTYRYTVTLNNLDLDGVTTLSNIALNGGSIKDALGDDAVLAFTGINYPNHKVDGVRPTISSNSTSADKTYALGETIDLILNYSENITISGSPRIHLSVGGTTRYATYSSGSGTSTITFRYTVVAGDLDIDGISVSNANLIDLNGGTLTDIPGNAPLNLSFSPPVLTGVKTDGVAPTITSVSGPAGKWYVATENLSFTVNFSENVTVTGTPTLAIDLGGLTKNATYQSGSGTSALIFSYTVVENDSDTNGVSATAVALNAGTIQDSVTNNATLTMNNTAYATVLVDAILPYVSSVTLPTNGAYKSGTLNFTLVFNESVTITGTPRLVMTVGSSTQYATYLSGSGTSSIVFRLTLPNADSTTLDLDGIAIANSSNINLNAGAIKDARLNNAVLGLGTQDTSKIHLVLPSMRSWYDVNDSSKLTFSSGNVTAINDKISTTNLTYSSGASTYSSTGFGANDRASVSCTSNTHFGNTSGLLSPVAMVFVGQAPSAGSNSQILFAEQDLNRIGVNFSTSAGTLTTSGATSQRFVGSTNTWNSTSASQAGMWSASSNFAAGLILSDTNKQNDFRLCRFNGKMSEAFIFTDAPSAAEMIVIKNYLTTKYGFTFN